ncbi:HupE/UreJ family protein [Cohnella mopanensis]|uniref:HupE/UreJ family protein n=1 Tax=Cohnella mopanensis TaxID=2911966 RepID=UPI001EF75515|nr:HupE/UreJ family protein [Cohnella mopanensis]
MNNSKSHISRIVASLVFALLLMLLMPSNRVAEAHAYSASYTTLELTQSITMMTFAVDELSAIELAGGDLDRNGMYDEAEFDAIKDRLATIFQDHLTLAIGGESRSWTELQSLVLERRGGESEVVLKAVYPPVEDNLSLSLMDTLYKNDKKTNYVNLLTAHYGPQKSTAALSADNRTWAIALSGEEYSSLYPDLTQHSLTEGATDSEESTKRSESSTGEHATQVTSGWLSFLRLGINHILGGYDHLLFLFSLLIARQTFKQYAAMITAFTVAHSVTLSLTVIGWINISPSIVEPLIALSICFVAVDNMIRRSVSYRWVLTFLFGLIHGMGFADILKGMELPRSELAVDLISFNVGIELVQLIIVAVLVPLLYRLHRYKYSRQAVIAGSGVALLMGAIWLIQRVGSL